MLEDTTSIFRRMDLRGVDLRGVDLRGVDLRGVDLQRDFEELPCDLSS